MTLSVIQGSFTKSTSTSVPVTQNITGLGFTPKVIWMWTNGNIDANFAEGWQMSYGFSDGTANGCIQASCQDNVTTSNTDARIRDNACCVLADLATPATTLSSGSVTGFSSGQVSFQWDTNAAGNPAAVIHYMIVGGTDITNVKVSTVTMGTTATGNKAYTGIGFQGDFIQTLIPDDLHLINTHNTLWNMVIGAATSSSSRWVLGGHSENAQGTSDTYSYGSTSAVISAAASTTGAEITAADFVSFDSDGFTLNYTNAPAVSADIFIALVIKGGLWDVRNATKKTSTGTQDLTITTGRDPSVIQLFSMNKTALSTTATPDNYMSIGGSDGTTHGSIWSGDQSLQALMVNTRVSKTDKCIILATPNATAASSTTTGAASVSDMATTGKVTLTWSTADSQAYVICYWVLSPSGAAPTNYTRPLTAETISISESIARLYTSNRAPTAETITIGESQARVFVGVRALSAETNTIGESMTRLKAANRSMTAETNTIGESLTRLLAAIRAPTAETVSISEAIAKVQVLVRTLSDTTAISESLTKILTLVRNIPAETNTIGESITRVFVGVRALSDTTAISESLARLKAATRALSDTTIIGESVARLLAATRSLSDTTVIGESLSRILGAIRALAAQTTTVGESLTKVQTLVRSLSDTTIISETINRMLAAIRSLTAETSVISESLTKVFTPASGVTFTRNLAAETVVIAENVVRSISNTRSLIETTVIGESLARLQALIRALSDTTVISETVARVFGVVRTLSQTTTISESLTKVVALVRTLSDTIIISETLTRLQVLSRALSTEITTITESLTAGKVLLKSLSDTVAISESLTKVVTLVRTLSETTVITESLARLQTLTRILATQIINVSDLLAAVTGAFEAVLIETVLISESLASTFLHIVKGLPLYLQPTPGKRPEGVGPRNRSMERDSPRYLRKQLDRIVKRIYGFGRTRSG